MPGVGENSDRCVFTIMDTSKNYKGKSKDMSSVKENN